MFKGYYSLKTVLASKDCPVDVEKLVGSETTVQRK